MNFELGRFSAQADNNCWAERNWVLCPSCFVFAILHMAWNFV